MKNKSDNILEITNKKNVSFPIVMGKSNESTLNDLIEKLNANPEANLDKFVINKLSSSVIKGINNDVINNLFKLIMCLNCSGHKRHHKIH